jgi:murein DD-endopeptidase MepM/ murein hydrolase activator NlpD
MKKWTVMIIPDDGKATRQVQVPSSVVRVLSFAIIALVSGLSFLILDYVDLRARLANHQDLNAENEGLKGEARLLMQNLDEVKTALRRVQDYTYKLTELTELRVKRFSSKTGIGPLSPEEFQQAQKQPSEQPVNYMPLGLNVDKLAFRPVFDRLSGIGKQANNHALELQQLLSTLSQQRSLLQSIPSVTPVDGWVTSGFGMRTSPFTGERTLHVGLDIAAPVGTPILAPADGIVIFTGKKEGFGNFVMLAHGYGVISRYGHNNQNLVSPGQKLSRGEQIATVGESGRTTGPHLHYEIMVNGKLENPQKFILNLEPSNAPF